MRFRTTISDVLTFTRITQCIEKVSRKCIIRLTPETMNLICVGDSEGVQIWSQINVDALFKDFRIESNFNNQINLEIASDSLLKALRSAQNAVDVTMRLAKRNKDPLLSFMIVNASRSGARLEIVQDVLIKVLKPAEIERIKEPLCPEPDVHIVLPPLQTLRTVTERMRSMSEVLVFSANLSGELKLAIEQDEVKLDTTWKGLRHPNVGAPSQSAESQPPERFRTAHLEMRSFLRFLSSYVVATTTIACICEGHCAIFYVYIGDIDRSGGVLTFFLPGLVEGGE